MLSILVGLIVVVVSCVLMIQWRADLFGVLRGLMPVSFFLGGLIAVIAGVSSLKKPKPVVKGVIDEKKA